MTSAKSYYLFLIFIIYLKTVFLLPDLDNTASNNNENLNPNDDECFNIKQTINKFYELIQFFTNAFKNEKNPNINSTALNMYINSSMFERQDSIVVKNCQTSTKTHANELQYYITFNYFYLRKLLNFLINLNTNTNNKKKIIKTYLRNNNYDSSNSKSNSLKLKYSNQLDYLNNHYFNFKCNNDFYSLKFNKNEFRLIEFIYLNFKLKELLNKNNFDSCLNFNFKINLTSNNSISTYKGEFKKINLNLILIGNNTKNSINNYSNSNSNNNKDIEAVFNLTILDGNILKNLNFTNSNISNTDLYLNKTNLYNYYKGNKFLIFISTKLLFYFCILAVLFGFIMFVINKTKLKHKNKLTTTAMKQNIIIEKNKNSHLKTFSSNSLSTSSSRNNPFEIISMLNTTNLNEEVANNAKPNKSSSSTTNKKQQMLIYKKLNSYSTSSHSNNLIKNINTVAKSNLNTTNNNKSKKTDGDTRSEHSLTNFEKMTYVQEWIKSISSYKFIRINSYQSISHFASLPRSIADNFKSKSNNIKSNKINILMLDSNDDLLKIGPVKSTSTELNSLNYINKTIQF